MERYGRAFSLGEIFSETFSATAVSWRAITAYALCVGLAASGSKALVRSLVGTGTGISMGTAYGLFAMAFLVVLGSVAGYFLLWRILANQGLATRGLSAGLFLANVGASIVMTVAIGVGMVLLIVPGLILIARWSVAPALIVGRGESIGRAMSESWELTRSRHWTVVGFYCLFFLMVIAVMFPIGAAGVALTLSAGGPTGTGLARFGIEALSSVVQYWVTGLGFCVTAGLFSLLLEHSGAEVDVFA